MKLTEQQIIEIADNLDCGMRCFYNLKTGEINTVINLDRWPGTDEEPWEEENREIEENWPDYFEFKALSSHDSFSIMADFTDTVADQKLQDKLVNSLNKPKPFRNFKWQIDNSGEYRQKWFDYKNMRYIEKVKEQIDNYKRAEKHE